MKIITPKIEYTETSIRYYEITTDDETDMVPEVMLIDWICNKVVTPEYLHETVEIWADKHEYDASEIVVERA